MKNSEKLLNFWEKSSKKRKQRPLGRNISFNNDFSSFSTGDVAIDEFLAQFGRVITVNLEYSVRNLTTCIVDVIFENYPIDFEEKARDAGLLLRSARIDFNKNINRIFNFGGRLPPTDFSEGVNTIEGRLEFSLRP